ncbi:MAG: putative toxin-antitoxin system toxin component, PIN family [Candidatus Firestonebacteria bacterium]|nr:putative toxin-antitoxin system toxin component, PIN family [Candidatus Firestonebacteria bacterium]
MLMVLDTNVLVSGLLSPFGAPAEILRMVVNEELRLCYDARILDEYLEVLARPKFEFEKDDVEALLNQIKLSGQPVYALPLGKRLVHKADEPFLEVLLSGEAECLVTGNLKHFPQDHKSKLRILSPSDFMTFWRKGRLSR